MNKKQLVSILVVSLLLLFSVQLFAQEADEDIKKSNRLDKVCELLQNKNLTKDQKAKLLYEKSYLMLTIFWVTSLRTGTESLLEAIELAPKNYEYKDFLCQAYDSLWKDKDFNDGGEFSKDFQAMKEKVRIKVEQYKDDETGEHYQLSFNNSKMIFDTGNQLSQNSVVSYFNDSYSLPWEDGVNNIYITLTTLNVSKLNINVKLPKVNIPKKEIIERIEKTEKPEAPFFRKPKVTTLLTLDKGLVLVKGLYLYVIDEVNMKGYEHPYFGVISANNDKVLIKDNYALLRVLLIDGKYYFITHFQKPESGARGVVIYRLENETLIKAFDYSEESEAGPIFKSKANE